MRPLDALVNGNHSQEVEAEHECEEVCEAGWGARVLGTLNALRKSRQHFDVVVAGDGGEVAAHRAVLAAASPRLLRDLVDAPPPPAAHPLPGVAAPALAALVEFAYTGRLKVPRAAAARRSLYAAAAALRLEGARAALAPALLRDLTPADALPLRALPALELDVRAQIDSYLAENFDELCEGGAVAQLPSVRLDMLRESSADDGEETPDAVAAAALAWLQRQAADGHSVDELCARPHLLYVDAGGALRDCGALPAGATDGSELCAYRAAAAVRAPPSPPGPRPPSDWAVLAARRSGARGTSALLAAGGGLVLARVVWSASGSDVRKGARLTGRGPELAGPRCAHGTAAFDSRVVVCGGYDRTRALRSVESYEPGGCAWTPLPDMKGARARFGAARLGARVYAAGGSDGHAELATVEALAEDGSWTGVAALPSARSQCALAADEERGVLYCVGGWAGGVPQRAVHSYRPAEDRWEEEPALLAGRSQPAAVVWGGAPWALGGCDAWHCLASTERLVGGAWEAGPALPTARRSVGGAVWGGRLVSAGGSDGAASLRRVDVLSAAGGHGWAAGPALREARAALGLAVLGGALYAVGGFDGKNFLATAEVLLSLDGEWTQLTDARPPPPPLTAPQGDHDEEKPAQ